MLSHLHHRPAGSAANHHAYQAQIHLEEAVGGFAPADQHLHLAADSKVLVCLEQNAPAADVDSPAGKAGSVANIGEAKFRRPLDAETCRAFVHDASMIP
jgi:hypothetical protein